MVTAARTSERVPEFVSVTVCAVLVVLSACMGKFKARGVTLASSVTPFPLKLMLSGPAGV